MQLRRLPHRYRLEPQGAPLEFREPGRCLGLNKLALHGILIAVMRKEKYFLVPIGASKMLISKNLRWLFRDLQMLRMPPLTWGEILDERGLLRMVSVEINLLGYLDSNNNHGICRHFHFKVLFTLGNSFWVVVIPASLGITIFCSVACSIDLVRYTRDQTRLRKLYMNSVPARARGSK